MFVANTPSATKILEHILAVFEAITLFGKEVTVVYVIVI